MNTYINFEVLEESLPQLTREFANALPFEHVVIDNFLCGSGLSAIRKSIENPVISDKSSDFMYAKNKFENPKIELLSSELSTLREEICSERFGRILSSIYGKTIFVDEDFVGGGLHQGGVGSFLDMHTDFTKHPEKPTWIRELNILLYLNKGYKEDWLGELKLKCKHSGDQKLINPVENRLVIMLTKPHTIHGYDRINFPPGLFRTSIAAYAYSLDDGSGNIEYSSTQWFPEHRMKYLLARFLSPVVKFKQMIIGSRTAKRASRK